VTFKFEEIFKLVQQFPISNFFSLKTIPSLLEKTNLSPKIKSKFVITVEFKYPHHVICLSAILYLNILSKLPEVCPERSNAISKFSFLTKEIISKSGNRNKLNHFLKYFLNSIDIMSSLSLL